MKLSVLGCVLLVVPITLYLQCTTKTEAVAGQHKVTAADVLHARATQPQPAGAFWYILSGGPGTGKTSVLEELAQRGYATKQEAATAFIRQELAKGIEQPWLQPEFQRNISLFHAQYEKEAAAQKNDIVFFDRGPVDSLSYELFLERTPDATVVDLVNTGLLNGCYHTKVFIFEDLGFCEQNEVRREDADTAKRLAAQFVKDYASLGFEIVVVPAGTIQSRADFIESHITPVVVKTPSGLSYQVLKKPSANAASPQRGHIAQVHYTGWLADANGQPIMNKKFDSSVDRKQPFVFRVGVGMVIAGWDEAVLGMKVGEKRRLVIPAALAYGARGAGKVIPSHATLVFDVELLAVS